MFRLQQKLTMHAKWQTKAWSKEKKAQIRTRLIYDKEVGILEKTF
jgi:hypothetical protein